MNDPWNESHAPRNFHRTDPTPHIAISEGEWALDSGALKWWLCLVSAVAVVGIIWRVV